MSEGGIRLTEKEMKYIQTFETVTGATVVDCVEDGDLLTFVVKEGDLKKALSGRGFMIKELVKVFRRRVKVIEFSTDASVFIRNLLHPVELIDPVRLTERPDGKTIAVVTVNPRDKGMAIGRDGKNINLVRLLAKRHFNIEYVTVR